MGANLTPAAIHISRRPNLYQRTFIQFLKTLFKVG